MRSGRWRRPGDRLEPLNRDTRGCLFADPLDFDPIGLAAYRFDAADYMARFQREAQVLAALNHTNIAAIYGLEDNAIVMELVEGPTLSDRIAQAPLSIEDALPIAKQIAEALEAAHEKQIIHRDLKPGNIKVNPDGVVKVLDFGLAKTSDGYAISNASISPTLTIRATEAGFILGTAAYMSPEQASGKSVDRRADIWAFGVVLWEMLTGKRLFEGETISHTLAHVLTAPIEFHQLPGKVPARIRELLRRCLDRGVKTRLRDIGEARIAIDETLAGRSSDEEPVALPSAARSSSGIYPRIAASVFALALAALAFVHFREKLPEAAAVRFTHPCARENGLRPERNQRHEWPSHVVSGRATSGLQRTLIQWQGTDLDSLAGYAHSPCFNGDRRREFSVLVA